ncbi:acetyltransferase (GNAT) family protein [Prosthecobacter fusiformis]|uniref:Acetyltransferase (GNAT) family protein n=1 Tax=Prosthecobacter fusiformis TaxID=48464 RepID=A0A4R7SSZ4_9BACT|nr:GNAT family N-acetyltransferase [Prosthecobacter fusiformis]TDU81905.1 acetyltransferase (GNAT) family protein [Prosthecobacter fusiformis]
MAHPVTLSVLLPEDDEATARLIHGSLVQWYQSRLGQGARFGDSHVPFLQFPQVYEALDPGEGLAARDSQTHDLLGVCFTHERETHVAVGIVATSPEAAGRGVARQMMNAVLEKARQLGKPVRLVSSALNLDSFSLYTKLGFVPGTLFQDMMVNVSSTGMTVPAPAGAERVREARPDEAAKLADFEHSLQGIRREKDFAFFMRNETGSWKVLLAENDSGEMTGFITLGLSFGMLGPGVAADEASAAALLWKGLDHMRGSSPVFLVPCAAAGLVKTLYSWGARNLELHVAQSTSPGPAPRGIAFPTFLPESA